MKISWFIPPPIAIIADAVAPRDAAFSAASRTTSSNQQFDALTSGASDLAVTSMDNVMDWNLRPGPRDFIIVAQIETTTFLSVVARPEIGSIQELAGKSLLVDAPANGFVVALRALLADRGIAPDAYAIAEVGGVTERMQALVAGHGDATLLGPPFDRMAIEAGMALLGRINDAYPAFPGQGIVIRRETLAKRANEVIATLKALEIGRAVARADRSLAIRALAAAGFSRSATEDMMATIPATLVPDPGGIALLIEQRSGLALPGADTDYDQLVDLGILTAIGTQGE